MTRIVPLFALVLVAGLSAVAQQPVHPPVSLSRKPLAADSFGHWLTLCFRNDRLIGMAINNRVP